MAVNVIDRHRDEVEAEAGRPAASERPAAGDRILPFSFGKTSCLEISSHLCHGCVTDAGRALLGETTYPYPAAAGTVPPSGLPPSRTATQPLPARLCMTRWAVYQLSAPVPDLSGAAEFLSRPGASPQVGRY
jgi:hypothetical protein